MSAKRGIFADPPTCFTCGKLMVATKVGSMTSLTLQPECHAAGHTGDDSTSQDSKTDIRHDPWGETDCKLMYEFGAGDSYFGWRGIHIWAYSVDADVTNEGVLVLARKYGARGAIWCFKTKYGTKYDTDYGGKPPEFRGLSGVAFLDWSYPACPKGTLEDMPWNNTKMEVPR